MKRKAILITGIAMVLAGAVSLLWISRNSDNQRSRYEKFLAGEYKGIPASSEQVESGEGKTDNPHLAAFSEYIKTLDPAIRAVPRERLIDAYRETEAIQQLKSGNPGLTWTHQKTHMGGRTRTLMFDPNDPVHDKLWAGSVTGGLWYNVDPARYGKWTPVNDFWSNLSVSCMTYDPNNTQTFYIGTGESQTALIIYRESSGRGTGILRSTDAGQTWEFMPSTMDWAYVTDILVRSENGKSVLYAGVASGVYKGLAHRNTPSDGLYRSTDDGSTWTQVLPNIPGKDYPYVPADIELNSDSSKLYVGTTYGVNEDGTDNDRSGAACILVSDDGINWTVNNSYQQRIKANPTNKYPGRVMIAPVLSDPNMMYAIVASGYVRSDKFIGYGCEFLLKTTDKGATWTEVNFPAGFASLAWHAFEITVSPFNPNVIWVGGLDVHRTTNGGTTWTKLSNWAEMYGNGSDFYVHADIHAIVYQPGSDSKLFIGTDGGVFGSRTASAPDTGVKFFESANSYSTLQYYSCAMHPDAGAIHFIGGLQDNGTMFYRKGHVPTFLDMLSGGDGALCFIDQNEPTIQLTTVYHNAIYLYSGDKEADPQNTGYRGLGTGTFVNPMDYDWKNNFLFANGANEQLDYLNTLHVMTVTSNSISAGTPALNLATQSHVPYSNIKWSEFSTANQSNIYIGTESGKIFKLTDASHNGTLTDLTPASFPTANVSSIDLAGGEDTLLVTFSNYGVPSVWLSVNAGRDWKNVEANLPDMPVRWGIFHPKSGKQVMLATEMGIWTTDNILAQNIIWSPDNNGLANVRVDMLKFRASDNTVLAASHGRGMFTTIWEPSFTTGIGEEVKGVEGVQEVKEVKVYPNPSEGRFRVEFGGEGQIRLSILDINGKIIDDEIISGSRENRVKSYDLTGQPRGTYILRVQQNNKVITKKVVIN